jgi:hypothetical protein
MNNFMLAIDKLGKTNDERAAKLGMTSRNLETWKKQGPPRAVRALLKHPELILALLDDAKNQNQSK